VQDYQDKVLVEPDYAADTIEYRKADYGQVILPHLGSRLISSVISLDIVGMLVDAKRTWAVSKRVLTSASMLFEWDHALRFANASCCKKTRKGFLVPIVPAVAAWFDALIGLSGESIYLLHARQERRQALTMWADFLIACETGTSPAQASRPTKQQ
jgi:hypothetical protein